MPTCQACNYNPNTPTPTFDAHITRIRNYLKHRTYAVTTTQLSDALSIPRGTLYNKWFRARAQALGITIHHNNRRITWSTQA